MSEYSKTAMSWLGLRDALLYFPYVIPLFELEYLISKSTATGQFLRAHEKTFLPPDISEAAVTDLQNITKAMKLIKRHVNKRVENKPSSTGTAIVSSAFDEAFKGRPGALLTKATLSLYVHL